VQASLAHMRNRFDSADHDRRSHSVRGSGMRMASRTYMIRNIEPGLAQADGNRGLNPRPLVGRAGLEPPTSALSRRERRSVEYATANDVTRCYQSCEFETAATRGISYPGGGGGGPVSGCHAWPSHRQALAVAELIRAGIVRQLSTRGRDRVFEAADNAFPSKQQSAYRPNCYR
jgi:hypothetical protein